MFYRINKLTNINPDLLDFLKHSFEEVVNQIESGASKFEKYLGKFEDLSLTKNDYDLLDLLEFRLVYINKLRDHYWIYETGYNENVYELLTIYFDNNPFEEFHFLNCENRVIKSSSDWKEDCSCFTTFYHAVAYDISDLINKRYEEICELEEKYRDLYSEIEDKIEKLEEEKENSENDKNN